MLPAQLWEADGPLARSAELTPVYVQRHVGVRAYPRRTTHEHWEMTILLGGHGRIVSGEACIEAAAPATFLIPPGLPHAELAEEQIDTIWIGLRGSRLAGCPAGEGILQARTALSPDAEELWRHADRQLPLTGAELDARLATLWARFFAHRRSEAAPGKDLIDRAVDEIQRDCHLPLCVGELAQRYGYSEGHFHRQFKARTGTSPMRMITRLRLRRAHNALVHSTEPVEAIARSVGYGDPLYFSRLFRRTFGQSPSALRRRHRAEG
jgi:AraC-like DNA-binding protein